MLRCYYFENRISKIFPLLYLTANGISAPTELILIEIIYLIIGAEKLSLDRRDFSKQIKSNLNISRHLSNDNINRSLRSSLRARNI